MVDMWYGNKPEEVDYLDVIWNDLDGGYSGNLYIGVKPVGDYQFASFESIRSAFPHLQYKGTGEVKAPE